MANICDFRIIITCPKDQANVIREAITSALKDHEGSAFGLILSSSSLAEYPPWDPHWTGIGSHVPYEGEALTIYGSCKWAAPVWLGGYLSLHYRVPVVINATIEHEQHEEWRINLHEPDHPDPLLLWERVVREIQYPLIHYKYREGKPATPETAESEEERERLVEAEASALRALIPADFVAGLPELSLKSLSVDGLDAVVVLGRYFSASAIEADDGRPVLEYLVIGRHEGQLVAIRQWARYIHLAVLSDDSLTHAYPAVVLDQDWSPRSWGEIRAEWLVAGCDPRLFQEIRLDRDLQPSEGKSQELPADDPFSDFLFKHLLIEIYVGETTPTYSVQVESETTGLARGTEKTLCDEVDLDGATAAFRDYLQSLASRKTTSDDNAGR